VTLHLIARERVKEIGIEMQRLADFEFVIVRGSLGLQADRQHRNIEPELVPAAS
jgi:hypothetical protein